MDPNPVLDFKINVHFFYIMVCGSYMWLCRNISADYIRQITGNG